MDNTELRQIPGLSPYFASAAGNIWKLLKGVPRYQSKTKAVHRYDNEQWFTLMRPNIHGKNKNYLTVSLGRAGKKSAVIHRLVLLAFNPRSDSEHLQVNHLDRNTFNNKVENLEWVTCKENMNHAFRTVLPKSYDELREDHLIQFQGLLQSTEFYKPKELGSWLQKYDVSEILEELRTNSGTMREIADKLGCSFRAVRYWQEKLKVKRQKTTLKFKIKTLIEEHGSLTPNQLASKLGVRVTSVHAVLRKMKSVTTIETAQES